MNLRVECMTKTWRMPYSCGLSDNQAEEERFESSRANPCKPVMAKMCTTEYLVTLLERDSGSQCNSSRFWQCIGLDRIVACTTTGPEKWPGWGRISRRVIRCKAPARCPTKPTNGACRAPGFIFRCR